ncbi:VOC family protein [Paeniglutamicibacter sp. NPDC091659]|uniref:VOC family protein n=1 Tax=Paeniglutamicibacter sp. NPDC091659 TaxID=3364389 RepID=UPI00380C7F9F
MKTQGVVLSLAVTDATRSHDFYREVLGAGCVRLEAGMVCIELPGLVLFLAEIPDFTRYSREAKRAPLLPVPASDALLSCAIASTGEVDEILSVAKAAGGRTFEPHEIPHVSGRRQYVGTFTDPDGHLWQLVCNLTDAHGAAN